MDFFNTGFRSYTLILLMSTLCLIAGSFIDCKGKAFHCVNSTHFKICVDLGGGVSMTVDEFLIPCPRNTVCKEYNLFECEYELTTTLPPLTVQSEVANEQFNTSYNSVWEQLHITTLFPTKREQGMELSEKYYNALNTTPASFTASYLTDAVKNPMTLSKTNDSLISYSDIKKPLNISLIIDKELTFSTTKPGIGVTQTLPYNINTLKTDIPVTRNYNSDAPVLATAIQDRRTIDSLTGENFEPLKQNGLDLDSRLKVTKSTNQVSNISKLPYSDTVTLLTNNFSDPSLQVNAIRASNLNRLIKSENTNKEHNVDSLIKYNKTQFHKTTSYTNMYSTNASSNINTLNSTILNDFTAEIYTSNVPNKNKTINVNSEISDVMITSTPSNIRQHLAKATTVSTKIATTNELSSIFFSSTVYANETLYNGGLNISKNVEESSVINGYSYTTTPILPETSTVKTNEISSQIAYPDLNYSVYNAALVALQSDKPLTLEALHSNITSVSEVLNLKNTELNIVNTSQYLTSTESYLSHQQGDTPLLSTSISEITSSINVSEVFYLNSTEANQVKNASQTDNINTIENVSSNIYVTNKTYSSDFNILEELVPKNTKYPSNSSFSTLFDVSMLTTDATISDTYDKIIVKYNSTPSVHMLPVLTTIDMGNETQTPALYVFDKLMTKKNLINYTTTISSSESASEKIVVKGSNPEGIDTFPILTKVDVPTSETQAGLTIFYESITEKLQNNYTTPSPLLLVTNTSPLDAAESATYNNIEDINNSAMANILSDAKITHLANESQAGLNVLEQKVSMKNSKNVSDSNTSLLVNTSVISKNYIISKTYNTANNSDTTTEMYSNVVVETYRNVTSFKSKSDLILKNLTRPDPIMMNNATDIDNNNITTSESGNNVAAEMYNDVTSFKSVSDFNLKKETSPEPVTVNDGSDIHNNIITTTEFGNTVTAEMYNGVTSFKPVSDFILKNGTRSELIMEINATGIDYNNITITEFGKNVPTEMYNDVTSLKPVSDFILDNGSRPESVTVIDATGIDNNNITITEFYNNVTAEMYNGVTRFKSTSDLIPTTSKIQLSVFKLLTATDTYGPFNKDNIVESPNTILNDHQSLSEPTTSLSRFSQIPDNIFRTKHSNTIDSVGLITSTDSVLKDLDRNNTSIISSLSTTLDKPIILTDKDSGSSDQVIWTSHNNDTTIINSEFEINQTLSSNSTLINKISEVYDTKTAIDTAQTDYLTFTDVIESTNTIDVTNKTIAFVDVLSDYEVVSDSNKSFDNDSKIKTTVTINPTMYINSNIMTDMHVVATELTTLTTLLSEYEKQEINKKQINYKNKTNNVQNVDKYTFGKQNLNKLMTENFPIAKLIINNNLSQPVDYNIGITDNNKNSFIHVDVKPNEITNNLLEHSLKVDVINMNNTDLNYTDKNVVINYSKSIPFSISNPFITDIFNASHNYFSKNITASSLFDKNIIPKKQYENKHKELYQINKNELVPTISITNIENEGNKTEYLLINPYKQVTTTTTKVNETIFKELFYNFSEPSFTQRNILSLHVVNENITSATSAAKNIGLKDFNETEDSIGKSKDHFRLSEIPNGPSPANAIKSLLTAQKSPEAVNNTKTLYTENSNLDPITENGFKEYVSDKRNESKISANNNVNRSEFNAFVKNISSYNNFSDDIIVLTTNLGVVNAMQVTNATKLTRTLTYNRNVSGVKNLTLISSKKNYINHLNATSKSSTTANNLLKNSSYETNTIQNKNHLNVRATALEFEKSLQSKGPLHILKMETNLSVSNKIKLELINEKDKITISDHTNRSDGIKKEQPRISYVFPESLLNIGNGVTKHISKSTQNGFTTPINDIYASGTQYRNMRNKAFNCTKRGKYSDSNDCNKFYICIGRITPIIGVCPTNTVFSEFLKQCTKNVTHCIRNNQFKCTSAGRFNNILCNKTYFICAKKKSGFTRFTLQCQKGYYLDKNNVKCTPELINISISDESSSKNTNELYVDKSKAMGEVSVKSENFFECKKEGKFRHPQDCRKYYVCKKGKKSVFRRKIKKCDSGEVFHRKKEKCVDAESYECDI